MKERILFPTNGWYLCFKTKMCALLAISFLLPDGLGFRCWDISQEARRLREWFNNSWKGLSSLLLVLLIPSVADYGSIQNSFSPSKPDRIVDPLAAFQCWLLQRHTWYALRARIDHKPLMHFICSVRVPYFYLSLLSSTNTY